jgi:hypothetical protein
MAVLDAAKRRAMPDVSMNQIDIVLDILGLKRLTS